MTIYSPIAMSPMDALLLFGTSLVAGGLNAVAGGGSFITFPTLIFTGVPPITANASNNTAMWAAALATVGAYRSELDVPRRSLIVLGIASICGGILGSLALLFTAPDLFNKLIPYLLLLATIVFIGGEKFKSWLQHISQKSSNEPPSLFSLAIIQLIIATYGGFFGAGMGILMLATLTLSGIKSIHTMNALKMFLGICINGIAIVPFVIAGLVSWPQTLLMAVAGALGGYFVARFARKIQPHYIRRFVAIVAVSMTIYFFIR